MVAGLAVERDEFTGGEIAGSEFLDDEADLVFADHDDAEEQGREDRADAKERGAHGPVGRGDERGEHEGQRSAAEDEPGKERTRLEGETLEHETQGDEEQERAERTRGGEERGE